MYRFQKPTLPGHVPETQFQSVIFLLSVFRLDTLGRLQKMIRTLEKQVGINEIVETN